MRQGVFEKIKVADFSWVIAGPMIAKVLADFGATVLHIESKNRPDTLRTSLPFKDGIQELDYNGYFPLYNSNKYGLALNLQLKKSIDIAKKIVEWSDIVLESFRPGVMERLGLSYKDLKAIKPDIIMLSATMQGQTGPHALLGGYGNQLVGLTGITNVTGWPDKEVVQPYGAYTDCIAPYFGVSALVAALIYRDKTGKGQYLDLSQYEAGVHFMGDATLNYMANHTEVVRQGNSSCCAAPHGAYRCSGEERWCAISVFNDTEWQALCHVMGKDDLICDERFATFSARKENVAQLYTLIENWTSTLDSEEIMAMLQSVGVPVGIVANNCDLFQDPQLNHRECFWTIQHSTLDDYPHPSPSFKLSETPAIPRRAAPSLGEHTHFVCTELLNITDDEFVQLLNEGVFE